MNVLLPEGAAENRSAVLTFLKTNPDGSRNAMNAVFKRGGKGGDVLLAACQPNGVFWQKRSLNAALSPKPKSAYSVYTALGFTLRPVSLASRAKQLEAG